MPATSKSLQKALSEEEKNFIKIQNPNKKKSFNLFSSYSDSDYSALSVQEVKNLYHQTYNDFKLKAHSEFEPLLKNLANLEKEKAEKEQDFEKYKQASQAENAKTTQPINPAQVEKLLASQKVHWKDNYFPNIDRSIRDVKIDIASLEKDVHQQTMQVVIDRFAENRDPLKDNVKLIEAMRVSFEKILNLENQLQAMKEEEIHYQPKKFK